MARGTKEPKHRKHRKARTKPTPIVRQPRSKVLREAAYELLYAARTRAMETEPNAGMYWSPETMASVAISMIAAAERFEYLLD